MKGANMGSIGAFILNQALKMQWLSARLLQTS